MSGHPSIQQLLTEATARYHSGDYRQAIQSWQQVLASEPNNQRAKEGIRMASLLMDEAQAAAESEPKGSATAGESPESSDYIVKVREGIQKVREYLAASRHMEAMEVCQSLVALAPRSAAVHEIVEEAREAYEAQPFIHEHLEIARQLFVQERLDEASAELHKVFFLNSNHAEARKLEAKILALRQKRVSGAVPGGVAPPETELPSAGEPETSVPAAVPDAEMRRTAPPFDFGDTVDLPLEAEPAAPSSGSSSAGTAGGGTADPGSSGGTGSNEDWESQLAQLDLGDRSSSSPASPPEAAGGAGTEEEEKIPLVDLSEEPERPAAPPSVEHESAAPQPPPAAFRPKQRSESDLDLPPMLDEETSSPPRKPERSPGDSLGVPRRRPEGRRTAELSSRGSASGSAMRYLLPLAGILIGAGAAWWYFGMRPGSSGNGGGSSQPPAVRVPRGAGAPGSPPGSAGRSANLGLSSSGSRGSASAPSAGVQVPEGTASPGPSVNPPSADEARREITQYSQEGRAFMAHGKYQEAVKSFSKVLDLDPANMEAKDQMDQAASKVQEQKRLEEDLQTAKEFFVEKDYESALRKFYRLPKDRNLGEVDLFIRNAWYNWAVVSMKGGNCVEALQRIQEVLTLDPNDQEAIKQQEVADHYKDRPKDRVFYAFTDRLTFRTLNQR
jgi:tetratricopeptide (TPR) repeat protein